MKWRDMFPLRIRQLRKELRMTQQDVAKELNVSHVYISQLETGKKPSIDVLIQLADLFGAKIEYMLGTETEEMNTGAGARWDQAALHPNVIALPRRRSGSVLHK